MIKLVINRLFIDFYFIIFILIKIINFIILVINNNYLEYLLFYAITSIFNSILIEYINSLSYSVNSTCDIDVIYYNS